MASQLYLVHHGIKGQRWGVRRFQNKDGSLTSAGKKRYDIDEHRVLAESVTTKSKAGRDVEIRSVPSTRIAKFLAAHNKKIRANAENTRNYDIKANGKIVGDMTLYKESSDSLNVVWVGIDDSQRGQGYATAAMIGALEVAKKSGCRHVTLEVPGNSPDARHIYESLGFTAKEQISKSDDVWGGLTSMQLDFDDDGNVIRHSELYHHGIKGQKWGVRRFQNKDGSLTAAGKDRYDTSNDKERFWTDERKATAKKIAKGAAIVAGVALVAYGGYKLSQMSGTKVDVGKALADDLLGSAASNAGKSLTDIDTAMVSSINRGNRGRDGEINCAHTSMAYILNSMFGKHVTAQGFSGVDEASGLAVAGRSKAIFDIAFSGIKHTETPVGESFNDSIARIPNKSTGVLRVRGPSGPHFINYERDARGFVTLIDPQQADKRTQIFGQNSLVYDYVSRRCAITEILDFSNASIGSEADSVFRYCIKE